MVRSRSSASHCGLRPTTSPGALPADPILFGAPIGNGSHRAGLTIGCLIGGGVMIIGGLVEVFLGIDAEGKPLEQVARPLTEVGSGADTP